MVIHCIKRYFFEQCVKPVLCRKHVQIIIKNQIQQNLYLFNQITYMLYPPKKRAFSPDNKITKDLSNLVNINSKFAGTGGSTQIIIDTSSLAPKKQKSLEKPKNTNIFKCDMYPTLTRKHDSTLFKKYYDRGDLPVGVDFTGAMRRVTIPNQLQWKTMPQNLDYHLYLPIFFQGLRQTKEPYKFLATSGVDDLMEKNPSKILSVLPQLIIPIKKALSTKSHEIICRTLKKIQKLVLSGQMIGQALVPYYRQILPIFNMFKNKRLNIGDKIDYSQKKNQNLADLIQQTLQILQKHGGEDAYINIKYMIPTYESCIF